MTNTHTPRSSPASGVPHEPQVGRNSRSNPPPPTTPARDRLLDIEQGILACIAIASIAIGVAHSLGFLESLHDRIAPLTLVVLGLIGAYLVVERRGSLGRLRQSLQSLVATAHHTTLALGDIHHGMTRLSSLLDSMTGDRFSELKIVYGLRSYHTAVSANEIKATGDHVFSLWSDVLREASTFLAFNYVSAEEVWGTKGWAFNVAHALQVARIGVGGTIKRVFVVDGQDELDRIKAIMALQQDAGMQVKWVLKTELLAIPLIDQYVQELGTWDFVVVDSDLVFRVFLDDKRHMQSCSLVRDAGVHRKAMYTFTEALHVARENAHGSGSRKKGKP